MLAVILVSDFYSLVLILSKKQQLFLTITTKHHTHINPVTDDLFTGDDHKKCIDEYTLMNILLNPSTDKMKIPFKQIQKRKKEKREKVKNSLLYSIKRSDTDSLYLHQKDQMFR